MTFGEIMLNLGIGLVSGVASGAFVTWRFNRHEEKNKNAQLFERNKLIFNRYLETLKFETEILRKSVEKLKDVKEIKNISIHNIGKILTDKPIIKEFDHVEVEDDAKTIGTVSSILQQIENYIKWNIEFNSSKDPQKLVEIAEELRKYEIWLIRCSLFIRLANEN